MFRARILGLGYYIPEKVVTNKDLEAYLDTTDEWIQTKIGVKERHVAADNEVTSDLAANAAKMALKNADISAESIDMIVLATNFPDHISPATSIKIQEKIGALNAFAFDIRAGGCPGLVYALSIASKFIADGTCKRILVSAADMNSRGIDWNDRSTAVILGDGAAAVILEAVEEDQPGIICSQLYTDPSGYYGAYVPAGGMVEPITEEVLKNRRQYFKMDGRAIFQFATKVFPESVEKIVADNNMTLDDIDFIIPHEANINIIRESMKRLGIPMEKTYTNVDRIGNTGGSSTGIAFAEAVEKGLIKRGDKVVIVAFGAGLCWGAILLEY